MDGLSCFLLGRAFLGSLAPSWPGSRAGSVPLYSRVSAPAGREHSFPLLVGSFLQKRGERPRKVWGITLGVFTESWGWCAHEAPFHLPVLMSGKCRSPFKARNFKALLRYIQKLLLGDGVGVLTAASTVGRWKEADPGVPLSFVVSGVGSCRTPLVQLEDWSHPIWCVCLNTHLAT